MRGNKFLPMTGIEILSSGQRLLGRLKCRGFSVYGQKLVEYIMDETLKGWVSLSTLVNTIMNFYLPYKF